MVILNRFKYAALKSCQLFRQYYDFVVSIFSHISVILVRKFLKVPNRICSVSSNASQSDIKFYGKVYCLPGLEKCDVGYP